MPPVHTIHPWSLEDKSKRSLELSLTVMKSRVPALSAGSESSHLLDADADADAFADPDPDPDDSAVGAQFHLIMGDW